MTVIIHEIFDVLGIQYITLNMSDHEKYCSIWNVLIKRSIQNNESCLLLLIQFQLDVLTEYGIYLFGDRFITDLIVNYEFDELKEAYHGEIVKQLLQFDRLSIDDAIPNIELCLRLLREIQDTSNATRIMYYLHQKDNVILLAK
jgi:hypothetical protein